MVLIPEFSVQKASEQWRFCRKNAIQICSGPALWLDSPDRHGYNAASFYESREGDLPSNTDEEGGCRLAESEVRNDRFRKLS